MARGGFRKNSGPKLDADGKALKPYKRRDGESSESSNGESSNVVQMRAAKAVPAEPKAEDDPAINPRAWAMMLPEIEEISRRYSAKKERTSADNPFQLPAFPKAAVPSDPKLLMAQDSALTANLGFASNQWLAGGDGGFAGEGFMFLGYTYLSELALRPEYRVMAETIADDATRKWIDFDVVGDEKTQQEDREKDPAGYDERMADPDERKKRVNGAGKTDKVKALQDDQLRLAVRDRYYEQARNGGFFGRSHLFHDIRTNDSDDINVEELKNPIGNGRDALSKTKVPIGSFKALKTIEPMWAYPLMYNAAYPWRQDWYNPQVWYVNGQEFHGSRLLTFIPHPVPDMLKPAYAFGGLSLTQMAKPYVDRWVTTVSSVNALIHSFSVMVLATDLSTLMQPGNMAALMARLAMFNMLRDNQGVFAINNKTEDFKNVSASLAGLHELQAQSQEHMCVQAGTLIETDRGPVPIEGMTTNDQVLTRNGFASINWIGVTGHVDTLIRIEAGDSIISVTKEHPIWSETADDFVAAKNVNPSHRLFVLETVSPGNMGRPSLGEVDGGGIRKRAITAVLSRTAMKSIMAMRMAPTTNGAILSCSPIQNIRLATFGLDSTSTIEHTRKNAWFAAMVSRAFSWVRDLGIALNPANQKPSKFDVAGNLGGIRSGANVAEICSRQYVKAPLDFVLTDAISATDTGNAVAHSTRDASIAAGNSPQSESIADAVLLRATARSLTKIGAFNVPRQPVYNISVANGFLPEFFANGILVHNCSVNRIPLVKFTGIQPAGLNASSEGELECYDTTIEGYQARVLDGNLRTTINLEQLSLWGEIDPEITHRWEKLRPITEAERGQKQKDDADTREKYVDMGSFSPQEIRKIAIEDPELPFGGLDPDDVPKPPAEEGLLGPGAGAAATEFEKEASGQGGDKPDKGGGASDAVLPFLAGDAEFVESDHPRAPDGKFGSGGGASAPAEHPHGSTPKFHAMVTKHKIPEAASEVAKSARALKQKQSTVAKYAKYITSLNEKVDEITNSSSSPDQLISLRDLAEAPTPDEINDFARGLVREGKVKDVLGFEDDKDGFKDLMEELSPQEKQDLMMLKGRLEALYPKAFEAAKETRKIALETEKAMKVMRKRIDKSPSYDDFDDPDDIEHLYADQMATLFDQDPEDLDDLIGVTSYLADEPISAEYAEILHGQKEDIDESAAERRRFDALSEEEQAEELAEKAEKERLDKAMEDKHRELTIEIAMRDGWKPEFNDIGSVTNRPESVKQVASSPTSIGKMYRFLKASGVEIPEAGKRFLDW
jgi:hypothetical protein